MAAVDGWAAAWAAAAMDREGRAGAIVASWAAMAAEGVLALERAVAAAGWEVADLCPRS